jgi:hypothetical protein
MTVTTCSRLTVYLRVPQFLVPLAPGTPVPPGVGIELAMTVEVTVTDPEPSKIQTSSLLVRLLKLTAGTFGCRSDGLVQNLVRLVHHRCHFENYLA